MANSCFDTNALQNTRPYIGAVTGGLGQYVPYATAAPAVTLEQYNQLREYVLQLQSQVIKLQDELARIKQVKDWLCPPPDDAETAGTNPTP